MGVPKFFRWISERYPKINQPIHCAPDPSTVAAYFGDSYDVSSEEEEVVEKCSIAPEFDRLYLDMNGILHCCSHNNVPLATDENGESPSQTEEEVFTNMAYYLDRVISDIVQPKELVFMAMDGVAPRAKLNQQRTRRYDIETDEMEIQATVFSKSLKYSRPSVANRNHPSAIIKEVEPGRFAGIFESHAPLRKELLAEEARLEIGEEDFHSNSITPGTKFSYRCTLFLHHYIRHKLDTDPKWQHLTIIFSGTNVPGEGEHKIMDFIRSEKLKQEYNPNARHCVLGQDADLIVLGLATHEGNFCLLREEISFHYNPRRQRLSDNTGEELKSSINAYIHNSNFELLHISVLRDYLAFELETKDVVSSSPFELEPTIDDFVFLTFLVGNDFLPHLPVLDIADEAIELLFYTYKRNRHKWLDDGLFVPPENNKNYPYLTHAGSFTSGHRLEQFLSDLGHHEIIYYDNKRRMKEEINAKIRKADLETGRKNSIPSEKAIANQEALDRENYRNMLLSIPYNEFQRNNKNETGGMFTPVVSSGSLPKLKRVREDEKKKSFIPKMKKQATEGFKLESEGQSSQGFLARIGELIVNSFTPKFTGGDSTFVGSSSSMPHKASLYGNDASDGTQSTNLDSDGDDDDDASLLALTDDEIATTDYKGRYYFEKFKFTPVDAKEHLALRLAYIEGLVWNLQYYYKGCVSWDWFYPYHYGPMVSDLVNIDETFSKISFDGKLGEPLTAYEQLLSCLPPNSAYLLPKPYRWLMESDSSPIRDFYPESYTVDMNGKRWLWEAVVILPFIDSKRLINASRTLVDEDRLNEEERKRNESGEAIVYIRDESCSDSIPAIGSSPVFGAIEACRVRACRLDDTKWRIGNAELFDEKNTVVVQPKMLHGAIVPGHGFPTLKDAMVRGLMCRKIGINVFGLKSRYRTAMLLLDEDLPAIPPASVLGPKFIGTTVYFRYPHLQEGFVIAVSDEVATVRGKGSPRRWKKSELIERKVQNELLYGQYQTGEGTTGSGGMLIPFSDITLCLRPLQGIQTLEDGSKVKVYAKVEIEVPIFAALWSPSHPDLRFVGVPARLEKDPYRIVKCNSKPILPLATTSVSDQVLSKNSPVNSNVSTLPSGSSRHPAGINSITAIRHLPVLSQKYTEISPLGIPSVGDIDIRSTERIGALPPASMLLKGSSRGFATRSFHSCCVEDRSRHRRPICIYRDTVARQSLALRLHSASNGKFRAASIAVAAVAFLSACGSDASIEFSSASANSRYSFNVDHNNLFDGAIYRLRGDKFHFGSRAKSELDDLSYLFDNGSCNPPPLEFAHGTTTLAFKFDGGIVAAVDSRASMGNFVGSKTTQKVLPITNHILGTMAGGAADCSFWIRRLQTEAKILELNEGKEITVSRASRILSNALYENRGLELSIGTMIMGFDQRDGASMYYVDNTGARLAGDMFAVGSGSTFALGILDTAQNRENMSQEEAVLLGIKAIRHATFRDAYSGGYIGVYVITSDGWNKVFSEDLALSSEPPFNTNYSGDLRDTAMKEAHADIEKH